MDKEQINELKPGDEVLIRGRFEKIKENGDFQVSYLLTTVHGKLYMYKTAVRPSSVIIKSPPKHAPTRLLKDGDIVKPRFVDGRTDIDLSSLHPYTVIKREDAWGNVRVKNANHSITTKAVFLELITPVEERVPYSVHEESSNNQWNVIKDKYVHGVHAMFPYKNIGNSDLMSREEAKARADEYSERLNAEWIKEQAND